MQNLFGKRANGTWKPASVWTGILGIALIVSLVLGFTLQLFATLILLGGVSYFFTTVMFRHTETEDKETSFEDLNEYMKERQEARKSAQKSADVSVLTTAEMELFEDLSREFTDKEYDPPFQMTLKNILKVLTFQKTK